MLTSLRRPKVHTAKIVTFVFGIHMYLKDCVLVHVEIVAEIKYVSTWKSLGMYVIITNQKQPQAVKKGAAKQSRIKSIVWHLRWLVRTRVDSSLLPSVL